MTACREEVGPEAFDALRFTALGSVAHRENYLIIASDYSQSFGTFARFDCAGAA